MADQSFFDKPKEQSLVKIEIVAKYFWAWATVIINKTKKKKILPMSIYFLALVLIKTVPSLYHC